MVVEDNIVANDPQNLVVETQCTNDNIVVTEVGQSSGLNRGDDETVVVTKIGESSRMKKDDKRSTKEVDDVFTELENIIEDVDVDMEDFRENYHRNVKCAEEEEPQEEEAEEEDVDLHDFDSASDCDGDYEADRNRAIRKLEKMQKEGMISPGNFYVGEKFGSKWTVLERVSKLAVEQRRQLHVAKNDNIRVRVICRGQTPIFKPFPEPTPNVDASGSGPVDPPSGSGPIDGPIVQDGNTCPWKLLVSKGTQDQTWRVKTFDDTHTCL